MLMFIFFVLDERLEELKAEKKKIVSNQERLLFSVGECCLSSHLCRTTGAQTCSDTFS